ncbi:chaplin [Streptomyces sp. HC44]|uniref:Chaplin n=1 Tax=Streptomyces scabichelini TaxID=2711217 RepID=A0A6G4UZM7_9ACTN|nr:chaplin [Streptomyces scabichelini]NGO07232.1 chaplin [Streptomyces scabichelini]
MRQVTRKGLMTVAAATGVLAATGGYAHADSGADGSASDSPGVASGNSVQAPVSVPLNVCGNTVNVIGLLNPAAGNNCANEGGGSGNSSGGNSSGGGSQAGGHTSDSSGIGSGNHVQVPVDVPVNVCGNGVSVGGAGNAAEGNDCANTPGGHGHETTPPADGEQTPPGKPGDPYDPERPGTSQQQSSDDEAPGASKANRPGTQVVTQPKGSAQLAATGSELPLGLALPVGAGALLMGAVLYRKARASA